MSTLRQDILDSLLAAVIAIPEIKGAVDDLPPANLAEPPPRPRPGFGEARRPYAFVVDGPERINGDETVGQYECELPIEIAVAYSYDPADGAKGCKRLGRALLGAVQAGIMVDPNRGGRAYNTIENDNDVGEAVPEERIGVALWRGHVNYSRARKDPASREATL